MTLQEKMITIGLCILGTVITRFLPFLIFSEKRKTPKIIQTIGKYLPSAVFGILVIYSLKNINLLSSSHGLPELASILVTIALHLWKRQMLISIAGGTAFYMFIQYL